MDTQAGTGAVDRAKPKLMSGPSAYRWRRIIFWGWVVAIGLLVISGLVWFVLSAIRLEPAPYVFIALIPGAVLAMLLRLMWIGDTSPREKAELELGYTTLPAGYPNVDHLHPTTGEVLRSAGSVPLSVPEFRALLKSRPATPPPPSAVPISGTSGVLMPPLDSMVDKKGRPIAAHSTPTTPPVTAPPATVAQPAGGVFPASSTFASIAPPALFLLGLIVAGGFGATARGGTSFLWIGLSVAAILPLILVPIWLATRARRMRVGRSRPDARIFDGLLAGDLRQAARRLGQGPMDGYWMTVAVTDEGLEFWARNRLAPELVVLWQDVVSAEPGEAAYSNGVQPAVVVETESGIGRTVVPVAISPKYFIGKASGHLLNELLFAIRDHIPRREA
jgi:hypothetical protein